MDTSLVALIVFAALTLIGAAVMLLVRDLVVRRRAEVQRRLSSKDGKEPLVRRTEPAEEATAGTLAGKIDRAFNRFVLDTGLDLSSPAAFLMVLGPGLLLGGALLLWFDSLWAGAGGFLLGIVVPSAFLAVRRSRRLRAIREQLPDAMDILARAVRAGLSMEQGVELVGQEVPNPLGVEFRRFSRQMDMGLSVRGAMRTMVRRLRLMEARIFATSVIVHRQTGGNLALTMERLAKVMRDRLSYRRQFRAATAGGRFATILIGLAGPLMLLYMFIYQPDYIRGFFEQPHGLTLLAIVVVLQAIGLLWIAGLLRNDY